MCILLLFFMCVHICGYYYFSCVYTCMCIPLLFICVPCMWVAFIIYNFARQRTGMAYSCDAELSRDLKRAQCRFSEFIGLVWEGWTFNSLSQDQWTFFSVLLKGVTVLFDYIMRSETWRTNERTNEWTNELYFDSEMINELVLFDHKMRSETWWWLMSYSIVWSYNEK